MTSKSVEARALHNASLTRSVSTASPLVKSDQTKFSPPPTPDANPSVSAGSSAFVVKYAFKPTGKGQLTLLKGDILKIYNQDKPDWWKALNSTGQKGWVPAKYLVPASEDQTAEFDSALRAALSGRAPDNQAPAPVTPIASRKPEEEKNNDVAAWEAEARMSASNSTSDAKTGDSGRFSDDSDSDVVAVEPLPELPGQASAVPAPILSPRDDSDDERPPTPPHESDSESSVPPAPEDEDGDESDRESDQDDGDDGDDGDKSSQDDDKKNVRGKITHISSGLAPDEEDLINSMLEIDNMVSAMVDDPGADPDMPAEPSDHDESDDGADIVGRAALLAAEADAAAKQADDDARAAERAAEANERAARLAAEADERAARLATEADAAVERERLAAEEAQRLADEQKVRAERAEALLRDREAALAAAEADMAKERERAAAAAKKRAEQEAAEALEAERAAMKRAEEEARERVEREVRERYEKEMHERSQREAAERAVRDQESMKQMALEQARRELAEKAAADAQAAAEQARAESVKMAAEAKAKEDARLARKLKSPRAAKSSAPKSSSGRRGGSHIKKASSSAAVSSSAEIDGLHEMVRMSVSDDAVESARVCAKRTGAAMFETETRFERPEDAKEWIDFLDTQVSSRFPGGLTLRKEPSAKRRCRVYLALPVRDVTKVREVVRLFEERFPKQKTPRTALRNVFLLPRQASALCKEGAAQREQLETLYSDVAMSPPTLRFEAHLYVALQWKRDKQTVPIDEDVIQAVFRDVLSPSWSESQLLRCYGQRVAKNSIKRLSTSAIVVVRAALTDKNVLAVSSMIEECAERWEQPAILTMAFIMEPGDDRAVDGGAFRRPTDSMQKRASARGIDTSDVRMFEDDDEDEDAAAERDDDFEARIKAENAAQRKAAAAKAKKKEKNKNEAMPVSPEWAAASERVKKDAASLPGSELSRIALKDPEADLEQIKTLGHGAMGTVWRMRHRESGAEFAVKVLEVKRQNQVDDVKAEISVMKQLDFAHLVRYVDHRYVSADKHMWIVLELAERGSVTSLLDDRKPRTMPERVIAPVVLSVTRGLVYLHARNIVHRDIKPENVLVNAKGVIKIGDFGISRKLEESVQRTKTLVGTPQYLAPEVVCAGADGGYGVKVDVWGLGMLAKEMAEGKPLFHDLAPMQALFRLAEPDLRVTLNEPDEFSTEFGLFISMCMKGNPEERASSIDLLDHIFVDGVNPLWPSDF